MKLRNILNCCLSVAATIGMVICTPAAAQAPEKSPLEQVEAMVFLNETGIISITYAEPWFWEVPYYAMSLSSVLESSLDAVKADCEALSQKLMDDGTLRLGASAHRIIESQLEDGQIKDIRLISSLLKKYSRGNEVDVQNAEESGKYKPLNSRVCSSLDPENPGYLQQMFLVPQNNPEAFFQPKCDRLKKTVACLNNLNLVDKINRRRQDGSNFVEIAFSSDVLSVVSGSHSGDGD